MSDNRYYVNYRGSAADWTPASSFLKASLRGLGGLESEQMGVQNLHLVLPQILVVKSL
jgi:hypothetical protein